MTDRELLEAAARAAGYPIDSRASFRTWREFDKAAVLNPQGGHTLWNPLSDDGDALRLAVKLGIEIAPDHEIGVTNTAFSDGKYGYNTCEEWGPLRDGSQDDPYAATRRAIVRAAAALAPTTPPKEPGA